MREIEDDVRRVRRERLLARGADPDYRDPLIYESVDQVLHRALEAAERDALLLPDFLNSDEDWTLSSHLRFTSHRPVIGPVLVFFKRRVLLPLTRWLFEYSQDNFRRQQHVNRVLFACIEALAIENARLKQGQVEPVGRVGESGADGS